MKRDAIEENHLLIKFFFSVGHRDSLSTNISEPYIYFCFYDEYNVKLIRHPFKPRCEKICLRKFANNKISVFVNRLLESITFRLAMSEFSNKQVFVVEQAGLNLILSKTMKTDFLASRPI